MSFLPRLQITDCRPPIDLQFGLPPVICHLQFAGVRRFDAALWEMAKWLANIGRLWRQTPPSPDRAIPFSIPCQCGHTIGGNRQANFQILRCPACGEEVFVLPISPLPVPHSHTAKLPAAQSKLSPAPQRGMPQLLLVLAYVLLGLVGISMAALIVILTLPATPENGSIPEKVTVPPDTKESTLLAFHQKKIDDYIQQGQFHLALRYIDEIVPMVRRSPTSQNAIEILNLRRKEIALYADLLESSLEEILEHAISLSEDEWYAVFESRYRGKSIIFDTNVRHDKDGKIRAEYLLLVEGEQAKLELSNTGLFTDLPPEQSRRALFGARLDRIIREKPGKWSIRFHSDSGVLLTDLQSAAISCPPLTSPEARKLLEYQRQRIHSVEP